MKILTEEDGPIIISGDGNEITFPKINSDPNKGIEIRPEERWYISTVPEAIMMPLSLKPGMYTLDRIRLECVGYVKDIIIPREKDEENLYLIYEIEIDFNNSLISFDVEIDSGEIAFELEKEEDNISKFIIYERKRNS